MRRIVLMILILFLMSSSAFAINISTFNIESGLGVTEGYWQYPVYSLKYFLPHSQKYIIKTADFINFENIDIIALTEIDGGSLLSQNINQVKLLSNLTALNQSIFFATYKLDGMLNQGNAILTKYPIIKSKKYRLPGRGEPRYLGTALLKVENRNISVLVTHLSLNKQVRAKQIKYISAFVKNTTTPIILTGDFNIYDDSELTFLYDAGLKRYMDCKSYPSWKPKICRDFIFVTDNFDIESGYIPKISISDHLPVVIDATLN